jgi:hypothetical protein
MWSFTTQYYKGDMNNDGVWTRRISGRSRPARQGPVWQTDLSAPWANVDGDTDVDLDDVAVFVQCISGPGIPASSSCLTP